ncbi:winged helix-turn-helix domain-containing protein [Nitrosopumilus sp.]|uniref:winged helix-turn-helix domain-containing protein n=1 Tax=Nitrosopumilus sp. TaxID=2024843 RepID=UPI0034A05C36
MMVKKKLQRFDLKVLLRLLTVMYESGHEKRTNLALNAKINYDTCVSYLEMLEFLGFAVKTNRHHVYDITPHGISLCKKKLNTAFDKKYNDIPTILD